VIEMTTARLDAIRDRLDDAPPAPWDAAPDFFGQTIRVYAGDHRCAVEVGLMCDEDRRDSIAALIAHAPTDLRDLLAEVERLREEVQDFQDDAYRAGQEAMQVRCAEVCRARAEQHGMALFRERPGYTYDRLDAQNDEARDCVDAIEALDLEVEP
jgi:outer membrane murein-binding lipoprotein Lpp